MLADNNIFMLVSQSRSQRILSTYPARSGRYAPVDRVAVYSATVLSKHTTIFFQNISPAHNGSQWIIVLLLLGITVRG